MSGFCPHDPFQEARRKSGVLVNRFGGERIPMILRHSDVRDAAKDWNRFSSDAPFRVPIPSEENVRSIRQLPIETDPPDHGDYRAIVEPFFRRALQPDMIAGVEALVVRYLDDALSRESIEVIEGFALPIQSHALAILLNVPDAEAEQWIGWGTHVFRVGEGGKKGAALEAYILGQLDRATRSRGEDFFSALAGARFRGRSLTREEMLGFANLTFAGGRDTIINSITGIIAYLCNHPEGLDFLRQDSRRIPVAAEEFARVLSPLTHIGRVCPAGDNIHGNPVSPGERISLCWAAANFDETVFDDPGEVRLDRRPNPHLAYGAGPHFCLGAPHARLVMRSLLKMLCDRVSRIRWVSERRNFENEESYQRWNGYESLVVEMSPI